MLRDQNFNSPLQFLVGPEFFLHGSTSPRFDLNAMMSHEGLQEQIVFLYVALDTPRAREVFATVTNWGCPLRLGQYFKADRVREEYDWVYRVVSNPRVVGVHSSGLCDLFRVRNEKRYETLPPETVLMLLISSVRDVLSFSFEKALSQHRDNPPVG